MTTADDPSAVLEQWTMDVSNLSPEVNHLLEEIAAKDQAVSECESTIKRLDNALQKQVKNQGPRKPHPKEDEYTKSIHEAYDRARAIQQEKCVLSEKMAIVLDRYVKRLDKQIMQLEATGVIPPDPLLPNLMNPGSRATMVGAHQGPTGPFAPGMIKGISAPITAGAGAGAGGTATAAYNTTAPSTTLANSALARLVTSTTGTATRGGSPANTPTSGGGQARGVRESSTDATKKRRLNLPAAASNLRQSSTGPGTPKAGTPQPRAGSVPRAGAVTKKDGSQKAGAGGGGGGGGGGAGAGAAGNKHLAPPKGGLVNPERMKRSGGSGAHKRKGGAGSRKKGGVSDADDSAMSAAGDESGSERLSSAGDLRSSKDGAADRDVEMGGMEDEDEEGGDTNLYCTCRSVSYGNMVACDNDDCPYEWFHWGCVGLTKEPVGKWYCDECRTKLGLK